MFQDLNEKGLQHDLQFQKLNSKLRLDSVKHRSHHDQSSTFIEKERPLRPPISTKKQKKPISRSTSSKEKKGNTQNKHKKEGNQSPGHQFLSNHSPPIKTHQIPQKKHTSNTEKKRLNPIF